MSQKRDASIYASRPELRGREEGNRAALACKSFLLLRRRGSTLLGICKAVMGWPNCREGFSLLQNARTKKG